MRIIQIIDSLETGGAERMAVNYANALAEKIDFSGLVVTRKEGILLNQVSQKVNYLYLEKKKTIDFKALSKLSRFIKDNNVEIIHAHSTSFFLAFLLKLSSPYLQLIWHDHYGDSEFLSQRPSMALRILLPFFNGIIAVNQNLKRWSEQKMNFKNVVYLPNFAASENEVLQETYLKGVSGKRILALANLRFQKDHFLLLEVAKKLKISHPEWTFHLVGKDFEDDYSRKIKQQITNFNLQNQVFIYGSRQDIDAIMFQSTIGILTSQSEGLPVALLEYGWHKKAVVVTNVGEIPLVIEDDVNGFIVDSGNVDLFYTKIVSLIENESKQSELGIKLNETIVARFSKEKVINNYLVWLQKNKK